jgi:hypothetical protein
MLLPPDPAFAMHFEGGGDRVADGGNGRGFSAHPDPIYLFRIGPFQAPASPGGAPDPAGTGSQVGLPGFLSLKFSCWFADGDQVSGKPPLADQVPPADCVASYDGKRSYIGWFSVTLDGLFARYYTLTYDCGYSNGNRADVKLDPRNSGICGVPAAPGGAKPLSYNWLARMSVTVARNPI